VSERESTPEIDSDEAIARASAGAYLLDVREPDEWAAGHSPLAVSIPMSQLQDRIGELPADEQLLIICHSGGRSQRVTDYLNSAGYDAVNVLGGMMAWNAAGGEIETSNPGATHA
jgi:rhodanese-related sulfurtransferase